MCNDKTNIKQCHECIVYIPEYGEHTSHLAHSSDLVPDHVLPLSQGLGLLCRGGGGGEGRREMTAYTYTMYTLYTANIPDPGLIFSSPSSAKSSSFRLSTFTNISVTAASTARRGWGVGTKTLYYNKLARLISKLCTCSCIYTCIYID